MPGAGLADEPGMDPSCELRVGLGHSADIDGRAAVRAALENAERELGGVEPVAGVILASVEYEHGQILKAVLERWPDLQVTGGTTDGELSSVGGFHPDSVLLILFGGEGLSARAASSENLSADPDAAVRHAVGQLDERRPQLLLSIFAPSSNASHVLNRIHAGLGERGAPVVGGLTGDHRDFEQMKEFVGSEVRTDSLTLLALYGDFEVSWGVSSGWFPLGEEQRVTHSEGNVVYRIGERTAVEAYKHYYSSAENVSLSEYPLALYTNEEGDEHIMRAVLASDVEAGTLTFAGEVPTGSRVCMTEVLEQGVLDGTRQSIQEALENYSGTAPRLAMLFSCAARQWVLGGQTEAELEIARAALPSGASGSVPLAGFYCFGEIVPGEVGSGSELHNETCVSLLLGN